MASQKAVNTIAARIPSVEFSLHVKRVSRIRRKFSSNKQLDLAPRPELRLWIRLWRLRFFLVALAEVDDHARVGVFAEEIPVFVATALCAAANVRLTVQTPHRGVATTFMTWLGFDNLAAFR
jgi:hypothetical protein